MIRRGKLLEIAAESPASGARFVGRGMPKTVFAINNNLCLKAQRIGSTTVLEELINQ